MRRPTVLATLASLLLAPAAAAAPSMESWFQDDNRLEFSPPAEVNKTLDRLDDLGVDRLRVSVFWVSVAPDPDKDSKPEGFDGRDPDAYPQAKWERFDRLVKEAAERGIGIMWDVTGPAPDWATGSPKARPDLDDVWTPDAKEFSAFMIALGTRYSGSFIPPENRPKEVTTPGEGIPGLPGYKPPTTTTTEPGPPLPRVDHWEIWNEPNWGAWLAPQSMVRKVGGKRQWVHNSPRLYRKLVDAAYAGLSVTGHASDTIMVGATAPKGVQAKDVSKAIRPEDFIRELYCVNRFNQVYRGAAAKVRGCPAKGGTDRFRKAHPGLFEISGYSHHPYELTFSPHTPPPDPKYYTIANLPRLSDTLRRAWLRYGKPVPSTGVPLFLTEFGYQTNPPDRAGVSLAKQAAYNSEAEYIAWRNPAVRSLTQYLLYDGGAPVDRTFQTGLLFENGRAKPSLQAYKLPLFLPKQRIRRGASTAVWGLIRPGANGNAQEVKIQFRAAGSKTWRTLATRQTSAARNYLFERVRMPGTGKVRLWWNGQVSRSVNVWAR